MGVHCSSLELSLPPYVAMGWTVAVVCLDLVINAARRVSVDAVENPFNVPSPPGNAAPHTGIDLGAVRPVFSWPLAAGAAQR